MIHWGAEKMAKTLSIAKVDVHLMSPFVGGDFGSKLFLRAEAVLEARGVRAVKRPAKVALTRLLTFNSTMQRPATLQRIYIRATKDGKITAVGHEG